MTRYFTQPHGIQVQYRGQGDHQIDTRLMSFTTMTECDTTTVSEEERHLVSQIFKQADPQGLGVVTGDAALDIFGRSNLPPGILSEIWDLADEEKHGFLLEPGVVVAVRLMGWAQKSEKVSSALAKKSGLSTSLRIGEGLSFFV